MHTVGLAHAMCLPARTCLELMGALGTVLWWLEPLPLSTHYLHSFGAAWLKVSQPTVAVLIAQFLCPSRNTKQNKVRSLKSKLVQSQTEVDSCNSTMLEQQFLPGDSSLLFAPLLSSWKLELEGKSSSCMRFPSISWWQETARKALGKQTKSKLRVLQVKQ